MTNAFADNWNTESGDGTYSVISNGIHSRVYYFNNIDHDNVVDEGEVNRIVDLEYFTDIGSLDGSNFEIDQSLSEY